MNPITFALAGLLAYRTYHGQGRLAEFLNRAPPEGTQAPPIQGAPDRTASPGPMGTGNILDDFRALFAEARSSEIGTTISNGLSDLIRRFQEAGQGATAQSWVGTGQNQPVPTSDLEAALGSERLDWLQQQTGLSRSELLQGLSRELPGAVDKLTPEGRVPNGEEAERLVTPSAVPGPR